VYRSVVAMEACAKRLDRRCLRHRHFRGVWHWRTLTVHQVVEGWSVLGYIGHKYVTEASTMVRRWAMSRFDGSAFMAISLVPPLASRLQTSWPTATVDCSSDTGMPSLCSSRRYACSWELSVGSA
jgi:hypothetical protein